VGAVIRLYMAGHHLCVIEIDDVPDSSLKNKQLIGTRTSEISTIIVVELLSRKKKNWLKKGHTNKFRGLLKHTKSFVQEHYKWYETEIEALEAKEKLIFKFAESNLCVLNNIPKEYCVYIVDLQEKVMDKVKRFREANQDCGYDPIRYLYIGQTQKTPEKRFHAHKNNSSGSKIVKEYGIELARDLMEIHSQYNLTKRKSLILEASLTIELRNKGTRFATYSK
jgi:hypothetical protein